MGRGRRGGDSAGDLRRRDSLGQKRERHRIVIGLLHFEARPIDRLAVEPGGRAGLQASEFQPQRIEPIGQLEGGRFTGASRRDLLLAHMDEAIEKGAGRQNHGAGREHATIAEQHAGDTALFNDQVFNPTLDDVEIGGRRDLSLHRLPIQLAVGLSAGTVHGRAFGSIEQAELDAGCVGDPAHQAVERVDLADQMTLAEPADGRVARHFADRREGMRDQRRPGADARRGGGRLGSGVPAADDDDVIHFLRR